MCILIHTYGFTRVLCVGDFIALDRVLLDYSSGPRDRLLLLGCLLVPTQQMKIEAYSEWSGAQSRVDRLPFVTSRATSMLKNEVSIKKISTLDTFYMLYMIYC